MLSLVLYCSSWMLPIIFSQILQPFSYHNVDMFRLHCVLSQSSAYHNSYNSKSAYLFQNFTKGTIYYSGKTTWGILFLNNFCLTTSKFFINIIIYYYRYSFWHAMNTWLLNDIYLICLWMQLHTWIKYYQNKKTFQQTNFPL